ncbi:MAG: hypothetical protein ACRDFB_10065 [Rhabdochlamydiaceae bacterium]
MTSSFVTLFNAVSAKVQVFAHIPSIQRSLKGLEEIGKRVELKIFKDFFVKPFMLVEIGQNFFWEKKVVTDVAVSGFAKMLTDANLVKAWLCAPNFLLQLPKVVTSFTFIDGGDRLGFKYDGTPGHILQTEENEEFNKERGKVGQGPYLSRDATVFRRLSSTALLLNNFVEDISFFKNYITLPKGVGKIAQWLQTMTGFYIGAQGFYQELYLRQSGVENNHFSEKYLNIANLVANFSYLCFGAVGIVGLCLGEKSKAYPLFSRCQFMGSCAVYLTPLVQYCFEQYRNSFIPEKQKSS